MKQSFVVRIKEKEHTLKETENEIHKRFEAIKRKNNEEKKRLEDERRQLEEEINNFKARKNQVLSATTLQAGVTLQGKQKKKSLINIKE
jgi:septin 6/8/11